MMTNSYRAGEGRYRIALLFDAFQQGGIGQVNLTLADAFQAAGHDTHLIVRTATGPRRHLAPKHVPIHDLKDASKLRLLSRLFRVLVAFNFEHVFASGALLGALAYLAALPLIRRRPTIVSVVHTNLSDDDLRVWERSLIRFVTISWLARILGPLRLASVSQEAASALERTLELPPDIVAVLYNPVRSSVSKSDDSKVPDDLAVWWNQATVQSIVIGRLDPKKRVADVLRAVATLSGELHMRLLVLGDGPERQNLEDLAEHLGIRENVKFLGFCDSPLPYLRASSMLITASESEAAPLVIAEALAHGINVVSSDCNYGPREILADGEFGFLAPVGNVDALTQCIIAAHRHPIPSRRLREGARVFEPGNVIARYLQLATA